MSDYNHQPQDSDIESAAGESHSPAVRSAESYIAPTERIIAPANPGEALRTISPTIAPVRTEQSPPEFVHLQSAIESHMFEAIAPSALSMSALAEEGLEQDRPFVLGISSAVPGEGKTTTAMHLAVTMARNSYKRVCLMDFSLSQLPDGDLGSRLRLYDADVALPDGGKHPSGPIHGIIDVLEEASHTVTTYQMVEPDNLTIVPAGRPAARPARNARSPRILQLLSSARHVFDVIIVDLPAVSTEYATPIMRYLDGVMLVVHSGATPRQMVLQAIELVGREKVLGVALNRYRTSVPDWLTRRLRL
ncbi:MAG: CpsD/CapB family tyrosine-protein kinase [Capsulimonadaceae bacterium]|nr:CpsD/CapB family tyrosine-protein kinase [Capsulimonadaceae bacterium]